MNTDQVLGVVRAIMAAVGGLLVQKGYIDAVTLTAVIGALVTLGSAVWSVVSNRSGKVIA